MFLFNPSECKIFKLHFIIVGVGKSSYYFRFYYFYFKLTKNPWLQPSRMCRNQNKLSIYFFGYQKRRDLRQSLYNALSQFLDTDTSSLHDGTSIVINQPFTE